MGGGTAGNLGMAEAAKGLSPRGRGNLAHTYRLLPSELDRLTLYDIWLSNLGPLWEQAQSKVKK